MNAHDKRRMRIVGWVVSILLLGAAGFTIWTRWDDLSKAIVSIERPNPWSLVSLP